MSEGLIALLIIGAFVIIFPLFWIAIIQLIARFGGWKSLTKNYAAQGSASGDHFRFASARFGRFTSYSNCLNVSVSPQGIGLRPFILFRAGHSALFLPWEDVLQLTRWQTLVFSSVQLTINRPMGQGPIKVTLYGKKLAYSLHKHAPHHLTSG